MQACEHMNMRASTRLLACAHLQTGRLNADKASERVSFRTDQRQIGQVVLYSYGPFITNMLVSFRTDQRQIGQVVLHSYGPFITNMLVSFRTDHRQIGEMVLYSYGPT